MSMSKFAASKRGFTLIELMIVVVIIGVLASLAIYGVNKYVASAKTGEARTMLGRMTKDAIKAGEGEGMAVGVLAVGGTAAISRRLCLSAAATIPTGATFGGTVAAPAAPTVPATIRAQKVQSSPADWQAGDANTGFRCLGTSITGPQYYSYGYTASPAVLTQLAAGQTWNSFAVGDLDGDGIGSQLWYDGAVVTDGAGNISMTSNPTIGEFQVEE